MTSMLLMFLLIFLMYTEPLKILPTFSFPFSLAYFFLLVAKFIQRKQIKYINCNSLLRKCLIFADGRIDIHIN